MKTKRIKSVRKYLIGLILTIVTPGPLFAYDVGIGLDLGGVGSTVALGPSISVLYISPAGEGELVTFGGVDLGFSLSRIDFEYKTEGKSSSLKIGGNGIGGGAIIGIQRENVRGGIRLGVGFSSAKTESDEFKLSSSTTGLSVSIFSEYLFGKTLSLGLSAVNFGFVLGGEMETSTKSEGGVWETQKSDIKENTFGILSQFFIRYYFSL